MIRIRLLALTVSIADFFTTEIWSPAGLVNIFFVIHGNADRYRIGGLLGKGGMGEVYRADDLKLGQPVVLELLPAGLAGDPGRLARFHNEVRVAREVSHPNVCRVHDIGEADGQHFLSMQYVDGEESSVPALTYRSTSHGQGRRDLSPDLRGPGCGS